MADVASDFQRSLEVRRLRQSTADRDDVDSAMTAVGSSVDLVQVAFALANDGRRLLPCTRFTVLEHRRGRCRVLAVSGVDVVNRRANLVRVLEQLAARVAVTGRTVWLHDELSDVGPELKDYAVDYLTESGSRSVAVVPLVRGKTSVAAPAGSSLIATSDRMTSDGPDADQGTDSESSVFAVLVADYADRTDDPTAADRFQSLAGRAAVPLASAMRVHEMPLRSLSNVLAKLPGMRSLATAPVTAWLAVTIAVLGRRADIRSGGFRHRSPRFDCSRACVTTCLHRLTASSKRCTLAICNR